MSLRTLSPSLALAAMLPLAACSPTIKQPRLLSPGPAPVQRYNATQFDPYPQNDVGPEIVGGRPPDYAVPPNEVERSRQYQPGGPSTALPVFVPATPVFVPTMPVYAPTLPPAPGPAMPPVEYRY